ncbi:hypothetical protein TcWFU_003759 [Taenia crassiceps]|uniref:Uncharacterized protein n=1 Tax=Taenia crassiceps TaxID=6207 RepID=A0ABR4QQZ2_9CEST
MPLCNHRQLSQIRLRVVEAFKASLPSRLAGLNRESVTSLHRAMIQCPKPLSLSSLVDTEVEKVPTLSTS